MKERPPKEKPNPLAGAKLWLGNRLIEKPSGYFLDGTPVSLTQIIRAYNEVRVQMGMPQIDDNPLWRTE